MTTRPKPNRGRDELERRKMYASAHWLRLRGTHLAQHPYCVDCGSKANVVDHFMGHADPEWRQRFWDPAYLASRCAICHNKRTATFDRKLKDQMKKEPTHPSQLSAMQIAVMRMTKSVKL